ncbi:hypothetical protein EAE91_14505 [Photorhabdus noenieputensis]|nr:hypothetical protein [Photorhabdus noenieputensis]
MAVFLHVVIKRVDYWNVSVVGLLSFTNIYKSISFFIRKLLVQFLGDHILIVKMVLTVVP